jgi:hypothetical protein
VPTRLWAEAEDAAVRAGSWDIPGRSRQAIRSRRVRLGVARENKMSWNRILWTEEEDEAIRDGATSLPGRTDAAVKVRRLSLGIKFQEREKGDPWTDHDIAYLKEHVKVTPYAKIAEVLGRTPAAVSQKASSLGIGWEWGQQKEWLPSGADAYPWKGGSITSYNYSREWTDLIRPRVLKRDGHQCRICGFDGARLEIHHIIPFRECREHSDDNLVTLCRSHHKWCENTLPRAVMQLAMVTGDFGLIRDLVPVLSV